MNYSKEKINVKLKTMPGWFFFYMPLSVPYKKLALEKGGAMWEKSTFLGRGWIGIEHEAGDKMVEGEFNTYIHKGEYKKLKNVFKNIMKDYPETREFYSIYLNSPEEVSESELETKIIFR